MIIRDDKDYDNFLKILVYSINTADGNQNSADAVTRKIMEFKLNEHKSRLQASCRCHARAEIGPAPTRLTEEEERAIYNNVLTKYKLLRIRSKISYLAFTHNMMINEFLLSKIQRAYMDLVKNNEVIPSQMDEMALDQDIFESAISNDFNNIIKFVM